METDDMKLLMKGIEEVFLKYGDMTASQVCENSGMNGIIECIEVAQAITWLEVENKIKVVGLKEYVKNDGSVGTSQIFRLCVDKKEEVLNG